MIYVSKEQLSEIEYLIEQSIRGNHVLFDIDAVRDVFRATPDLETEEAYAVEPLIERLITQPSLAEKRAFLDHLDRPTYQRVLRTYFNIVENNLFETAATRH